VLAVIPTELRHIYSVLLSASSDTNATRTFTVYCWVLAVIPTQLRHIYGVLLSASSDTNATTAYLQRIVECLQWYQRNCGIFTAYCWVLAVIPTELRLIYSVLLSARSDTNGTAAYLQRIVECSQWYQRNCGIFTAYCWVLAVIPTELRHIYSVLLSACSDTNGTAAYLQRTSSVKLFVVHKFPVAQWLRCCATNRKVAGSIPADVSGFFIDIKSFRSHYGPEVDSVSTRNEYQKHLLRVKAAGA